MRIYNKMPGLSLVIFLAVFNALLITVVYILLAKGINLAQYIGINKGEITSTDILFIAIPSLVAALGIKKRKTWGWLMFVLASGAYLHSMVRLLISSLREGHSGSIIYIAVYFLLYVITANIYLWNYRYVIDFD